MIKDIHIGQLIQKKMEDDGRKVSWLADKMGCHRNNIYLIYQQKHLHSVQLIRISQHLRINLFSPYYEYVNDCI